jgi:hypothetical protein
VVAGKGPRGCFISEEQKMKIYLAGSIAGKTREREQFLLQSNRLMSFFEINGNLFNSRLSFQIRTIKEKTNED